MLYSMCNLCKLTGRGSVIVYTCAMFLAKAGRIPKAWNRVGVEKYFEHEKIENCRNGKA